MYRLRAFNLMTVSTDRAGQSPAVLEFLKKQYASSPNKQFATADRAGLQAAWGAKWNLRAPLTMVIAPGGEVLYQKEGKVDILEVRRHHPRRHAGHARIHRLEGVLDGVPGGWEEARQVASSTSYLMLDSPVKIMPPTGLDKLKHIVVLMMENRSFDHMLGGLKATRPAHRRPRRRRVQSRHDRARRRVVQAERRSIRASSIPIPNHHFAGVDLQIFDGDMAPTAWRRCRGS